MLDPYAPLVTDVDAVELTILTPSLALAMFQWYLIATRGLGAERRCWHDLIAGTKVVRA